MDVRVLCATCKKGFLRSRSRVHEARKMHWEIYCSAKCQFQPRKLGRMVLCSNSGCANMIYRMRKEIRKVQKSYCSRSCAAFVNNRNKPKRVKNWHACANKLCHENVPMYLIYCSRKCFNVTRTTYASGELIGRIKAESQRLQRTPAKREMRSIADMCVRTFGSWNKSIIAAGLMPNRSHSQRMYRRTKTIAYDGHRCDSISEALVDNWLSKNGIPHARNTPYPGTGHKADWSICDSTFVEYFGLATDSPRYDKAIRLKRKLCKNNNVKLIEIYSTDLYPSVKLEIKLNEVVVSA